MDPEGLQLHCAVAWVRRSSRASRALGGAPRCWLPRRKSKRPTLTTPTPVGFAFVRKEDNPDFFLQRVGGKAGTIGTETENRSFQSNYFIKVSRVEDIDSVLHDFRKLVFPFKDSGVGPKTISKKEILRELYKNGSIFVK